MLPQLGLLHLDSTAFHDKIVFVKTNLAVELSWILKNDRKEEERICERRRRTLRDRNKNKIEKGRIFKGWNDFEIKCMNEWIYEWKG